MNFLFSFAHSYLTPFFSVLADSAKPWQLGFQSPATPTMEGIIVFHHQLIFLIVLIVVFVG